MRGGAGRGQGQKKGYRKPDDLVRKRIPMTTIKPENYEYLIVLKKQGYSLAKVFDKMIDDMRRRGNDEHSER